MASFSWPGDARLAFPVVVNVEEGAEMSLRDGDKGPEPVDELGVALTAPIRDFGNESNSEYGIRAGAPRVLSLLSRFGVSATFTAAAVALERAPDLARAITDGGHEACAHGWRWVHQFKLGEEGEREFVRKATDSIAATTGQRPIGWLSRYLHTPALRATLTDAENEEKFFRCCGQAGMASAQAEALRDLVARADALPDVTEILRAFSTPVEHAG